MYKLPEIFYNEPISCIIKDNGRMSIPFNLENSDYIQFKKDLANGVQLSDANNSVMTAEQVTAFMATLP
jgi:hypothetical protein